jgi:hypothetical protein
MEPAKILSLVDCETERTPAELVQWVGEKNELFKSTKEGRAYLAERQGLARCFIDKMYPLSLLVTHLFNHRIDVVCKPNVNDDDCDAVIVDYRKRPLRVRSIVFTRAILSYEAYLRRLYLPDEEHAFLFSRFAQRDRRDHKSKSEDDGETLLHVILLNKALELIANAAKAKANRPYGKLATLVIAFDDYGTFRSREDLSLLEDFVITEVLPMNLHFGKLYLLGWSGSTIIEFSVVDHGKLRRSKRKHRTTTASQSQDSV